jgi:hypothetical protein
MRRSYASYQASSGAISVFSDPERQSCSSFCHPWLKAEPSGFHAPGSGRREGIGQLPNRRTFMLAKWPSLLSERRAVRSDLKIFGKDSAGQPLTVQLHAQAAKTDLPKLIWMKRRIESLLQGGKTKEAIALAEKANLVCRGATFIAFDDTEEVAIAQDAVYQPSLDVPSGVACRMDSTPGVAFLPAAKASLLRGDRLSSRAK